MPYDFDTLIDRCGTASEKWDTLDGELPMWVADMDFRAAPEILAAVEKRAAHGVYGYALVPDEWRDAYVGWWERRHGFRMEKEWFLFCTGIVPAIASIIRRLTAVGEGVLVQTPVYNGFFGPIVNNGRRLVDSPLVYDGKGYHIDFDDLARKLADPQVTLMLLCNPHNPAGILWDRGSLARIGELCRENHVLVLADEIHCDIVEPGREYIPFASISEACAQNCVLCLAPTKTFNLAGLKTAAVAVPDTVLRHKVKQALFNDGLSDPNAFAADAAIAAYAYGAPWVDALNAYVWKNSDRVQTFLAAELPQVSCLPLEATYLLWLDCSNVTNDSARLAAFLRKKTGLWLCAGSLYGDAGRSFLRMNIACPTARLEDGLQRLKAGITAYEKEKGAHSVGGAPGEKK